MNWDFEHVTPDFVGERAFHLTKVSNFPDEDYCYLSIIMASNNTPKSYVVVYNYPSDFGEVVAALDENCPMHMVGFVKGRLGSAASVWGHVCPCLL